MGEYPPSVESLHLELESGLYKLHGYDKIQKRSKDRLAELVMLFTYGTAARRRTMRIKSTMIVLGPRHRDAPRPRDASSS